MTALTHLRYSPFPTTASRRQLLPNSVNFSQNPNPNFISFPNSNFNRSNLNQTLRISAVSGGGDGGNIIIGGNSGGGGGGDSSDHNNSGGNSDENSSSWWEKLGLIGVFIKGWRERVAADPQFPFKVLMEEVVGVTSCVLGDMASRPNFGLNELDFVFSTLIVGSILNFTLMYLLAPTISATSASGLLPGIFATCPASHMFEPGSFGVVSRCGTFVYKGLVFAGVGFAAGLVGTAISNGLIAVRKKMDPEFETPNKPPPTLLNAFTWAAHMGISSNFRYQALNGVEYVLEKAVPSGIFKTSVIALRCANNVLGGASFVVLARLTGSQSAEKPEVAGLIEENGDEKEKEAVVVVSEVEGVGSNQST